ncbi:MAG: FKBP-type peptidyl-prolyl cis-trans isomerase [Fibrobacterota bacterium]
MSKFLCAASIALIFFTGCLEENGGQQSGAGSDIDLGDIDSLETDSELFSYALGYGYGRSLEQISERVDKSILFSSLLAGLEGEEPMITPQESQQIQQKVMQEMQQEQQQEQESRAAEGEEFLEHNKKQDHIQVTESGLQYEVIEEGEGDSPTEEDQVEVHYEGTLLSGEVFDSSRERGNPATFGLNQVIDGWKEGIQLMKEGATYKFFVPPELGYGEEGAGQQIGSNEVLIFEVELLDIKE